jgi:hypothetical protein
VDPIHTAHIDGILKKFFKDVKADHPLPDAQATEFFSWFGSLIKAKYAAGQEEHGGELWMKNVTPEIVAEIVDLIVYVYTDCERTQRRRNKTRLRHLECIKYKVLSIAQDLYALQQYDDAHR